MPDTICAVATPLGQGGIGIVRVSGPSVVDIAVAILKSCPEPRRAVYRRFTNEFGETIDMGIALFYHGPYSYTGEDVLELHGHGSRVAQEMLLNRVLECDARLARPGEFTERAFLNGRLDLAQAEAVADLIESTNELSAKAALRSLTGDFSKTLNALDRQILELRVFVESAIDFAEEEIDFLADEEVHQRVVAIQTGLQAVVAKSKQGVLLHRGVQLVIAGEPNVGKSSLLNVLHGQERAIVTDVPGTTRDTLDIQINLDGLPVTFVDTAGIRESTDPVEQAGMERTHDALRQSDATLWVVDDRQTHTNSSPLASTHDALEIRNKCDLSGNPHGQIGPKSFRISALTGAGIHELRDAIKQLAGYRTGDDAMAGRPRHLRHLRTVQSHVDAAAQELKSGAGELVAELLRAAHTELGAIVGETTTDDLLGEIFSKFCIGK